MGRSVTAYTCPCGWVGVRGEVGEHRKNCKTYKEAIKRDNDFKRKMYRHDNGKLSYKKPTYNYESGDEYL